MGKKGKASTFTFGITMILYSLIWLATPLPYLRRDSVWQLVSLVFWLSVLICGVFLLRFKKWARILLIFQISLWGLIGLYTIFALIELYAIVVYAESIYFLLTYNLLHVTVSMYILTCPEVKEQFS